MAVFREGFAYNLQFHGQCLKADLGIQSCEGPRITSVLQGKTPMRSRARPERSVCMHPLLGWEADGKLPASRHRTHTRQADGACCRIHGQARTESLPRSSPPEPRMHQVHSRCLIKAPFTVAGLADMCTYVSLHTPSGRTTTHPHVSVTGTLLEHCLFSSIKISEANSRNTLHSGACDTDPHCQSPLTSRQTQTEPNSC